MNQKKQLISFVKCLAILALIGCGAEQPFSTNNPAALSGTFVSNEMITSLCFGAYSGPQEVAKLTVSFLDDSVCIQDGCSDAIRCAETPNHISIADRLKIVGKDCVFTADKISCAGITLARLKK